MSGLFVRLWLLTCGVGLLGIVGYDAAWWVLGLEDESRWYDEVFGPALQIVADDVARADNPEAVLARRSEGLGYPVRLVERHNLGAEVEGAWEAGYRLGYTSDTHGEHMYAAVDNHRALAFGPLPGWTMGVNRLHLVVSFGVVALMSGVLGLVMWPLHRSQRRLEGVALAMASGDLTVRLDEAQSATPSVARAFNAMAEQMRSRLERERALVRAVSHELRTPLSRLHVAVSLLVSADDANRRRHAAGIQDDLDDLDRLVKEITTLARLAEVPAQPVEQALHPLIADAVRREAPGAEVIAAPEVRASVSADRFTRAIRNLLRNAVLHGGGRVRVTVTPEAWVSVEDDGPGIPMDQRTRVREPFVRLGTARPGTGLGLSIAQRIVDEHGGRLTITDSELGGAQVTTTWGS